MTWMTGSLPDTPIWTKTGTLPASSAPISLFLPIDTRVIEVLCAANAYMALGDKFDTLSAFTATDEVHTLTMAGSPTGGTFTLGAFDEETTALTFDESAADVDTALEVIFGSSQLATAGGALPTAITITYSGTHYAGTGMPKLSVITNALTGGTNPRPVIEVTTAGRTPYITASAGVIKTTPVDRRSYPFLFLGQASSSGAAYTVNAYR